MATVTTDVSDKDSKSLSLTSSERNGKVSLKETIEMGFEERQHFH